MDDITHELYSAHAAANIPVTENPTLSTNPFFKIAIRHEFAAYDVLTYLNIDYHDGAKVWTWDRWGLSFTVLPDGRQILIGGQHEDWCVQNQMPSVCVTRILTYSIRSSNPQFFIFNDVVVYDPY